SNRLWLAVDEVVHHDDVMIGIIIPTRARVSRCDPDSGDPCVVKHDAEEGEISISRRGRNVTAKYLLTILVEVLDQRACLVAWVSPAYAATRLGNIGKKGAEATHRCRHPAIGTGNEEQPFGNVAPYRCEQSRRTECREGVRVGRIIEQRSQS